MFFHPEFNNYHPPELEYKINQEYLHELEEINSDKERYFLYLLFKEEKIKKRPREVYYKIFKNCPHSIINHIGLDIIKNDLFLDEFYEVIFSLEVNILLLNEITLNLLVKFNGKFKWEKVVQLEFEWLKKFVLLRNFVFYAFTNFYENFDELYKINLTNMNDIEIVEKNAFGSKIILFSDLYFSFAYELLELNWENCDFLFIFFFTNPRKQILNEKINQNNFIYLLELYSYTEFFYEFIQKNLKFVYSSVKNIKKTAELINLYTNSKVKFVSQESFIEFIFKEKNKKEEFYSNNKNLFEGQSINQEEIENLNKFCKEIYMLTSKNNINEYLLLISLVKNLYYNFFDNLFLNFLSSSNISIYATFLSNSDKFIPVRKVQKYLSKLELFNLFKEFFKNVRSTDFTSKEECFIRKNELSLTSFDEICELKTCDYEENSGEQSFNSIFDNRINFKKIYQNFSHQKNSDVLTKHIKEFLALILESYDPDFIYLLPLVPYIPPEHETYLLIYKIYILLFQYDLPDLILFNIKTPALLVSNIITIQDDTLIDNLSKITFKFNCFNIFENNSTILFLGIIYYSELAKLNNFNYSGILNYIMDSTMINLLRNNLILIIKCVHEECMFENKSFNKKYAEEIVDLLLSKYLSTEEEVWHTSEKILILILRILVNKDIDLIYNVKIHKSISYIIKDANQNDLLSDYISLYVNILQKMKNTPNFLNYAILFTSDYKYFYRYIIPLESKSFDELVSKTKEFSKKIKEFSSTKDIVTLYQEYKDDSLDWFIDLFHLKKESIFSAISLLKMRYLINYDFNDLFLLLYFLDYQENYEFYAYLYVIKRKRSIFNTSLKCKGMFKYYFLSKKSKSNSFEESVLFNNLFKIKFENNYFMKNDWTKEVKKIMKDFLLINQNISYQCKSIIDLINDPFLFRVFINENNNLQNEQVLIYKKGFTYEIQGYFITEDSITPLDLISLIYFTDSKLSLFYLNILPNKIIQYLLPQLIQGMKKNKEIISVFKEEEIIHNVLFLLLSNICEKCYSLINKLNLLTCKECSIFLECFYKLRDTLFINSFNKQIFFINKLKEISEGLFSIKLSNKSVKKILIDRYIENISVNEIYFPFDYDYYVRGIVNESGIALQSAAKVPYMITLIVQSKNNSNKDISSDQNKDNIIKNNNNKDIKNNNSKDYSIKDNNIKNNDFVKKSVKLQNEFDDLIFLDDKIKNRKIKNEKIQNENNLEFKKIIVKMGDDCRQDILTMQIIELFNEIFLKSELNIKLFPYKILTIRDVALIECVPDAITRDQMGKEGYLSIMDYFENKFGFRECKKYDLALQNFVSSYVGYSLLTYFVNIKDRHNANIMINKDGNLIHIDFGFIMELSPGNLNFELPVKLTTEIHNLLKSGIKDYFEIYKEKMVEGFLAIRRYSKEILNLVRPFSFLPCFKKDGINNLINRFKFNLSDKECKEFVLTLIEMAKEAKRTWIYDTFQYLTNDIRF